MNTIGKLIEDKKTETGKSDEGIAEACGLSKQTIHRLRNGGRANSLSLGALSRYLGIPYRTLVEMNDGIQPQQNKML